MKKTKSRYPRGAGSRTYRCAKCESARKSAVANYYNTATSRTLPAYDTNDKKSSFAQLVMSLLEDAALPFAEAYESKHALEMYRHGATYRERDVLIRYFSRQIVQDALRFTEWQCNEIAMPSDVRKIVNRYAEYDMLTRIFAYLVAKDFENSEIETSPEEVNDDPLIDDPYGNTDNLDFSHLALGLNDFEDLQEVKYGR